MKALDLLKKQNYPAVMFYGPAGTGKTALCSQAKNSYMFDFDNGMRTAALMDDKFSVLRQNTEFDIYYDDLPSSPKCWLAAEKKINELSQQSAQGKLKEDCIIIDSLTGMAKAIQLQVMAMAGNPFGRPQIQHYGTMVGEMEKALTILRSLKCLLLVTAHEMAFEADGVNLIRPLSITSAHSKNKIMWLFDEVLHTKLMPAPLKTHKYIISGYSTASIAARTRSTMKKDMDVSELGLAGVLKRIGYNEGVKIDNSNNRTSSKDINVNNILNRK